MKVSRASRDSQMSARSHGGASGRQCPGGPEDGAEMACWSHALLQRRRDNAQWALPGALPGPGPELALHRLSLAGLEPLLGPANCGLQGGPGQSQGRHRPVMRTVPFDDLGPPLGGPDLVVGGPGGQVAVRERVG
jgi:hypothetical protein